MFEHPRSSRSAYRQLPNSLKNWRASLLIGPWDSTAIGTNSPSDQHSWPSGRFLKSEQWERWRAKRKFVYGSKHRGHFCGDITPGKIFIVYEKSCNVVHFGWKMVRNAVHNAFLNTLTMGTPFPRISRSKWPLTWPRRWMPPTRCSACLARRSFHVGVASCARHRHIPYERPARALRNQCQLIRAFFVKRKARRWFLGHRDAGWGKRSCYIIIEIMAS